MTFFNQSFMGKSSMVSTAQTLTSNDLIRQAVASNQNAIGFLSMGYVDSTVKALPLDGVVPNLANAKSGTYPYVRPFVLCTNGPPTGLAKDFIEYALSPDGQAIAAKDYLPPVGSEISKRVPAVLRRGLVLWLRKYHRKTHCARGRIAPGTCLLLRDSRKWGWHY